VDHSDDQAFTPMATPTFRRVIVIGASAGGLDALRTLTAELPDDFPSPICVVLHTSPQSPGILGGILARASRLPVRTPRSGEPLRPGRVYVAPPDRHMLLEPGLLRLTRGPRENRFRPAVDPLFRSAAQVYGPAAIGVVLTGNLDDGTAGLATIKQLGGVAIVQDPRDAQYPSMPSSALGVVDPDHCVPLGALAPLLASLAAAPIHAPGGIDVPDHVDIEVAIAREEHPGDAGLERIGVPSPYACPECHGVLLRLKEAHPLRFRCHTGHAYSAENLLAAVEEGIGGTIWNAIRALEEGVLLLRHLAAHQEEAGEGRAAREYRARAIEARRQADALRAVLDEHRPADAASQTATAP
jgi:two-component system, chemotaxis family, protein-glutamate methylesterase/glutaminase